jgi:hypothetical protein
MDKKSIIFLFYIFIGDLLISQLISELLGIKYKINTYKIKIFLIFSCDTNFQNIFKNTKKDPNAC